MGSWCDGYIRKSKLIQNEARKRHTFCGPVTDHHFAVVTDAGRFRLCHAPHAARWSVTSIGGAQ